MVELSKSTTAANPSPIKVDHHTKYMAVHAMTITREIERREVRRWKMIKEFF